MSDEDRRTRYARAIWSAMVDDEPPPDADWLWFEGYLDAADAVIALTNVEGERLRREIELWHRERDEYRTEVERLFEALDTLYFELLEGVRDSALYALRHLHGDVITMLEARRASSDAAERAERGLP